MYSQKVADSRQGVMLQLGGWARHQQLIVKNCHVTKHSQLPQGLDGTLGTTKAMEKGHEIWHVEQKEPV
jgi:hypothetical protein